MPDAPLDARERSELCELFLAVGPDAPTLCEGWTTLDLAAHLVVRERDPRSGFAILGGERFAELARTLMDGARAQGYERLVERLRAGPPLVPWRLPPLRQALNLSEWFVHHEDVRRGGGDSAARTDRPDLDAALWALLRRGSRLMLRKVRGVGVALDAPGFGEIPARGGGPTVRLTGHPQELMLYLNGRRTAADLEVTGPDAATSVVETAPLGF
ncbi:MAG TPA: TIGR03085 family metal-binding protein [Acidimicrobiales bacterium]|nr:TIGR03085 family metal-binding protein [Acidimicrobiales bacterium]